ncbi:MAG: hypothetical protein LIO97_12210 [Tannerellaceae bacterium]|nr:hypothetical protein [Tannerellaceae bacterium]
MKNNLLYFRFRTWHFCVLLTGFSLFVFLAETVFYRQVPEQQLSYLYEEVTGKPDNIRLGFILFTGNEPYSGQMEHILADTALQHGWDAQLFRVNAEEASELSAA